MSYNRTYGTWFRFAPLHERPTNGAQVATHPDPLDADSQPFTAPVWAGYLWPQDSSAGDSHEIAWDVHLPALDAARREGWL